MNYLESKKGCTAFTASAMISRSATVSFIKAIFPASIWLKSSPSSIRLVRCRLLQADTFPFVAIDARFVEAEQQALHQGVAGKNNQRIIAGAI